MTIRRLLAATTLSAVVLFGATGCPASSPNDSAVEVEDCDEEDYANREVDCGFTQSTPTGKATPKKTKSAPKAGTTKKTTTRK
jgi:hypothetical protein